MLLDLARDGQIELALSDEILDETLRILRDNLKHSSESLRDAEAQRAITLHVEPSERPDVVQSIVKGT